MGQESFGFWVGPPGKTVGTRAFEAGKLLVGLGETLALPRKIKPQLLGGGISEGTIGAANRSNSCSDSCL